MKLLIASGGGGHFAPALAVVEKLPKDWDVLIVGRKYTFEGESTLSFEYQTAQKLGIPFRALTTGRLQRKFTRHTFVSLLKLPYGLAQALVFLQQYKPDVVLSFGGYVAVPVCLAAKILGIPIVIHEQTLDAGLATKITAKFADKICLSWAESERHFDKEKVVLTGNPIRNATGNKQQATGHYSSSEERVEKFSTALRSARTINLPIIYVTGGSGGAHAINVLIEECLEKLLEKYVVIHQTGDAKEFGDYERLEKFRQSLSAEKKDRYNPQKFVDPATMIALLREADLVISRSGINTVTELLAFGKPCLLIPLPYGQKNEQLKNAMFVKEVGLAEVYEQKDVTAEKLSNSIEEMFGNYERYARHAEDGKKLIKSDAAEKVIEVVLKFASKQDLTPTLS